MRKLLISFLITLGAFAAPNLWAQSSTSTPGGITTGGVDLKTKKPALFKSILMNVCGFTESDTTNIDGSTISGTPQSAVGDVYFVAVNDYWIGTRRSSSDATATFVNVYKQVNEGVTDVVQIDDDKIHKTNSGKFYPYEAVNVDKFFFIERIANKRLDYNNYAYSPFTYYNEWSYFDGTESDASTFKYYDGLEPCLAKLQDGAPFFSPHNCSSSLENNHYITLNDKDDHTIPGYSFTCYLYIPTNTSTSDPYVFFYRIKLGEIGSDEEAAKTDSIVSQLIPTGTAVLDTDMTCYYNVNLDWGTSFDRFRSQLTATSYDNMQEHFIIQRSFDKTNWVTVGTLDVTGNDDDGNEKMKYEKYKNFTDNTLPDFDETTKKIGYTVYYRIVSEVRKTDETVMSTTNSNIITVNIPGSTPFKLTLEAGGTSDYTPGSMDGDTYNEGSNKFVNTLTAGRSLSSKEDDPTLGTESVLKLILTTSDAEGNKTEKVIASASCAKLGTSSLDALINAIGEVEDSVRTDAGEKYDAQYQLVLELGDGVKVESNIVSIVNSKVKNVSVAVHRSGTPDDNETDNTCAATELFHNEITFTPQVSAVPGAGYYIYCNGKKVLTLNDNTNNKDFTGDNGTKYTIAADGTITVELYAAHDPIAEGETGGCTDEDFSGFYYSVAHFDPIVKGHSNTYGSAAAEAPYNGAIDELVINVKQDNTENVFGYNYNYVWVRPMISWQNIKSEVSDVKTPVGYKVYMKMGKAPFEEDGKDSSGQPGNMGDVFDKYQLVRTFDDPTKTTETFDFYYARQKQTTGGWVNKITEYEVRPVSFYVKAIFSDAEGVAQNVAEKNSNVLEVKLGEGSKIFTAIDDVQAEGVSVEANDGVITVTGVRGTITVYSASGQTVATAQGDGGVTTIDASNLSGIYIVKAIDMIPTKILIK